MYLGREIVRINGQARWHVSRTENDWWLGKSDELNLVITARKWANMVERMARATDMLLRRRFGDGELESFVMERGWALVNLPKESPFADGNVLPEDVTFDLPFVLEEHDDSSATDVSP